MFVTEAEPLHDAGGLVLDDHIGVFNQCLGEASARFLSQVEADTFLAAVEGTEASTLLVLLACDGICRPVDTAPPVGIATGFNLNHLGAEIGQHARCQGTGPAHAIVKDVKNRTLLCWVNIV